MPPQFLHTHNYTEITAEYKSSIHSLITWIILNTTTEWVIFHRRWHLNKRSDQIKQELLNKQQQITKNENNRS